MSLNARLGAAAITIVASASLAHAGVLSDWNLVVRTNVTSSSEVDGSALIGGQLGGNSSNYAVQNVFAPNNVGLAVAGGVIGGNKQVNNGRNFRYTTAPTATVNLNGGGNAAFDATIGAQVANAFTQVSAISAALSSLTPNGTVDGGGNMNAAPVLISGQRIAVYSINAASLGSLGQLNLNFGTADAVIINVAAVAGLVNFQAPPNFLGGFNQANASRIIWNLPDATLVRVNNTFNGALLAVNADLKVLGGGMNGSVVVNSISEQNAEIRRFNYNGWVPDTNIPAPGVASIMALAGLAATRRRR